MKAKQIILITILLVLSLIATTPFIIMVICCFSTNASIKGNTVMSNISLSNLISNINIAFENGNLIISLINSFVVSFFASIIGVLIASFACYGYEMYKSKFYENLYLFSTIIMYIPTLTILIPFFLIVVNLNLLDSYFAVILASISLPFLIFLIRQNTKNFPTEIFKAAKMDGASDIKIFFFIFLPYIKPVLVCAFLLSFIDAWNAVILPSIVIQSEKMFTSAVYLSSLGSIWRSDYAAMMVALVVASLPLITLYFIFQKYIIRNII